MNLISNVTRPSFVSIDAFLFFILLTLSLILVPCHVRAADTDLTAEQKQTLIHLLKQDCGSCHGMRLKGGLGPELTQSKMAALGVNNLTAVIKYGRPGTAMPPWQAILSDTEIQYIAEQLVSGVQ